MPTLFVLSGPEIGRTVDVADGALLGRGEECQAVLHEGSVSRTHARLERGPDGWAVVDLDSRNGLSTDGQRVKRLLLEDGAVFRLGKLELRFRVGSVERTGPAAPAAAAPAPVVEEAGPEEGQDFGDEIRLEGFDEEVELEGFDEAREEAPPRKAAPRPSPPPTRAARPAAPAPRTPTAELRGGVLQYNKVPSRSGFGTADLAQYPTWVRWLVVFVALAVFVVVFLLAFKGGSSLSNGEEGSGYESVE